VIGTSNTNARFDVSIHYRDGRDPVQHTNVSEQVAEDLERSFTTDSGVSRVTVTQIEPANAFESVAAHGDTADEVIKLTADAVVFGEFAEGRFVLLIERGYPPYRGFWALPGGHVNQGEETEDAARRELFEETGIRVEDLTYSGVYAGPGRDPRGRYVTFAYVGRKGLGHRGAPTAGDDATRAVWVPLDDVLMGAVNVAFDHGQVIRDALKVAVFYHS
jgi:8-oxo-dGTP diphosphatase